MISSQTVMTPANRPKSALPYAFTEQGVAMLSSVLNSDKAIDVNISIMGAFVLLRQYQMNYEKFTPKALVFRSCQLLFPHKVEKQILALDFPFGGHILDPNFMPFFCLYP
jgi:hypothetical protein